MNNYLIIIAIFIFSSCSVNQDFQWEYNTEVRLINETNYIIRTADISCEIPDIPPNDTLIYEHVQDHGGNSKSDKPNLDNIEPVVPGDFFYGNTTKCEREVNVAREDYKQTGEFEFGFTFRFTEERFQNARECN